MPELQIIPPDESKLAYSIQESMEALGIGRSALYQEIANGRLETFQIGSRRLISKRALNCFIEDREREMRAAVSE